MARLQSLLALLVLTGCWGGGEQPPEHLATCPAPDGRAVATVVYRSGGGAAGWAYTEVRVHRRGVAADSGAAAFATPSEAGVKPHAYWTRDSELTVQYPATETVQLTSEVPLGDDTVWVTPQPVRGMQLDLSDRASCQPYRPGGPLAPAPSRDTT